MVFGLKDKEQVKENSKNSSNQDKPDNNSVKDAQSAEKNDAKETLQKEAPKQKTEKEIYETKIQELTDTLQRLQAEFENSSKRSQKQNAEFREFAAANLIEQLLPVLDSLEQGVKHNKEFILVHEQLSQVLKKNGLEKIQVNPGNEFDHDTMECLMQEESDKIPEGKVAKVLLVGYKLNNKILRLTKVSVSSGKHKEETKEQKETSEKNKNEDEKSEEKK